MTQITPYQWHNENLLQATSSLNGKWLNETPLNSQKISTDTRTIQQGDIFLALSGENFDGHNYAKMAEEKGAIALIVERELTEINLPQLIVKDCRLALGKIGAYRRQQHKNVKIIAITGSSGKTTVKEMLASIFTQIAPTLVTRGNLNNDLGVPMMLLELADEHQFAILELGANHLGEIAYSAELVQADVACILNIGTAHLGEFGGQEKIAQAKAEIYQALSKESTAIIPENDKFAPQLTEIAKKYTQNIIGFGQTDFTASDVIVKDFSSEFILHDKQNNTSEKVILPLAGEHNVSNALAVTACARALGVAMNDIVTGLKNVQPPKGRLYRQQVGE
ncbi:MAG: UDP-N-acetylmuramoyl-tripeptide--D-alanyl-D-alanine ligase, partial [Moraxellaceae bacterium]|nr:UDP-N-acetylmuramoyl-tripeptide--D-alanyl-D-alanine ligase [Moraxellaceae bacterium]